MKLMVTGLLWGRKGSYNPWRPLERVLTQQRGSEGMEEEKEQEEEEEGQEDGDMLNLLKYS